jgi:ribosomal protein L11 methylase PrmA
MRRLLPPGGFLIVSGVIAVEEDEVREMLVNAGFRLCDEREEGDWRAFALQRA